MLQRMHLGPNTLPTWLALCVALIALAGCETQPAQRERPSANRQLAQAEQLARDGDHAGAAQAYEALAAQSQAELRDRLLLRAARERTRAGQLEAASNLLSRVSTTLPSADYALRAQVAGELALANNQPEKALAELDRMPQPLSRDDAADVLALRARAQFALNRPAAGVSTALERERALSSTEAVRDNQRLIWNGLQRSAAGNADFTA